ncbi:hypothetical protein HUG10_20625 (plasmid) [Halorarum halophilum]|uniref:Uncharacterized protein n=1 Tax=Halorarum halophilum TaxID=2743090 RepID=A0A7D5KAN1_9EURY|nr:hypothetical protein [Halobaculum halophilum]QLG30014.1 hypothetical protein HUG10_20625 [Halobaculum halophilum]
MENELLGCPDCEEPTSFRLEIHGQQEKATFSLIDGQPKVVESGSVYVQGHDPERICCQSCGLVMTEDDLVVV